jgi:hypothetical protein
MVQELLPTFSREDQISLFIFDRQGKLILPRAASCRLIAVDQTPAPAPGTVAGGPPPPRVQASVVRWNDQSDIF